VQAARGAALTSSGPADGPDAPDDRAAAPLGRRRIGLLLSVALLGLALDVVTKVLVVAELEGRRTVDVGGFLTLRVSRNTGAAFSLGEGYTVLFTAVAVAVLVVIARVARRLRSAGWAVSLGLLLAGATGNLVDRLLRDPGPGRGGVVDFLDLGWWPSFNVADSCICVGGAVAFLLAARGRDVDGTRETGTA
jgi:signal peptidase II